MNQRIGVLVMAYGTPGSTEDIEAYYTHIRNGRPPEPTQLADLTARYDALGGTSPLAARTEAQRAAIADALDATDPGRFVVALGQKHTSPFIEDGVATLAEYDVDRIIGVVLAPHYSRASVGEYHARAAETAGERDIEYVGIDDWYALDAHVSFHASALRVVLDEMPQRTKVVFSAHSLPERVLVDDPYADQLFAGAELIATRAGLARWAGWGIAWQSAGRTPEPWRGPDLLTVIDDLADTGRAEGIVVVPHGFTSDHLEVLYDIDIEASRHAARRGLELRRPSVVNADPAVMGALAAQIRALAS